MGSFDLLSYFDGAASGIKGLFSPTPSQDTKPYTVEQYVARDDLRNIPEGVRQVVLPKDVAGQVALNEWNDIIRFQRTGQRDKAGRLLAPDPSSFKAMNLYADALQNAIDKGKITNDFAMKMFANALVEGGHRTGANADYGANPTVFLKGTGGKMGDETFVFPIYTELTNKSPDMNKIDIANMAPEGEGANREKADFAVAKMLSKYQPGMDDWSVIRAWNGSGQRIKNGKVVADADNHVRKVQEMYKLLDDPINAFSRGRFKQPFMVRKKK